MKGAMLYGPGDVRFEEREAPKIEQPTDAIIRLSATCICGSDLWPYRGLQSLNGPTPIGHEYCGIVEEVGNAVKSVKPGQFVIGLLRKSDNTCPNCHYGYQSSCVAPRAREPSTGSVSCVFPLANGTLVATPDGSPRADQIPSLLAAQTCWERLVRRGCGECEAGRTVAVVGDGAVGLLGDRSAKQMGAERIIAMSRHEIRQKLAREFGATDIVTERGEAGVARIQDLTKGDRR